MPLIFEDQVTKTQKGYVLDSLLANASANQNSRFLMPNSLKLQLFKTELIFFLHQTGSPFQPSCFWKQIYFFFCFVRLEMQAFLKNF